MVSEVTLNYHVFLLKHARQLIDLDKDVKRKVAIEIAKKFQMPRFGRHILMSSTITRHADLRVSIANDLVFMSLVLEREAQQPLSGTGT